MSEGTLTATGLHKRYGGVRALCGVDFVLRAGEIHGLIGENGSGKSTLLKILAGQLAADQGRLALDGRDVRFADAARAMAAGIATVTQETTLVPDLSVAENIFLGPRKPRHWYGIDWRGTRGRAEQILARLNLDVDPRRPVGRLRPDQQQMVEIARALSMDARVVILDEPTSSLPDDQVAALFDAVRALRDQGVAVAFVSHRINEMFDLVDRLTILRDGLVAGSGPVGDYDRQRLISLMIGRELEELQSDCEPHSASDPVLRVSGLTVPGLVQDASLEVEKGEIVGLAGLVGAGRSSLLHGVFGMEPSATGRIEIDGTPTPTGGGPLAAIGHGVGYVPADRKTLGLVLDMSVQENLLMARTCRSWRLGRPRRRADLRAVGETMERFRIVAASPASPVVRLSGGNQQKVVVAKWVATDPKVLLLDEPTRGVDVGAKAEIYKMLTAIKDTGVGILISSSETPELKLLCDRILVMHRGRIAASLGREEATETLIAHYAMGHG